LTPEFWAAAWPYLAAVTGLIGGAWAAVRRLAPVVRRVVHLVDDLAGEPARPGVAARPGVMERLAELEVRTAELAPNGGESIKDKINRMDRRLIEISGRLRAVEAHTCPPHEAE